MKPAETSGLKTQVHDFWNAAACDSHRTKSEKFTKAYFDDLEVFRYKEQGFIHGFAQFTRYYGKKVLEVGIGPSTDFIQWLRAGALATGIDLTEEAVEHLKNRVRVYGLPEPQKVQVADAERLPFDANSFDLGYSFGVLHHSPDMEQALAELVRVVRPGGEIKIMLYNRHSIIALTRWIKCALFRGRPWKSLSWVLWHHMESIGTKAYTRSELRRILCSLPLENIRVVTEVTAGDYLSAWQIKPLNLLYRLAIRVMGYRPIYHLSDYHPERFAPPNKRIDFFGNRLGFFHCITAVKSEMARRES